MDDFTETSFPRPQTATRAAPAPSVVVATLALEKVDQKAQRHAAASDDDASSRSRASRLANGVNDVLGAKFYALGRLSARYPWRMIAASWMFAVLLASGLGARGLKNENRSEKLWVPSNTQAQGDKTYVDTYYGSETRFAQVVLKSTTAGENILTPAGLDALNTVITAVRAASITWEGSTYSYNDHCYRTGSNCWESNVLTAFANAAAWDTQDEINTALTANPITNQDGSTLYLEKVAGGLTYNSASAPTGAVALSATFLFTNNEELVSGDMVDKKGDAFDTELLKIFAEPPTGFEASYVTDRSFGDEFGGAINADLLKLQIALFLILAYAAATLSKWNLGCVGSRVGVTFAGIVSIGMAIASAYGLCAYLGLFFSPLMNVLPFLLLGIGVDDMFVIVNAYDNEVSRDPVERMGQSLRSSGMSITVTSLTDVVAFLIGSSTSLPALRNFCFYAALGIFFDYVYQVTFFTAFLTLDERRKANNKGDCFFCLDCPPQACCRCCSPEKSEKSILQRGMGRLGSGLRHRVVKYSVLVFFTVITIMGIIGCVKMEVDADVNNFIPDGSYLKGWFADSNTYFTESGDSVELYSKATLDLAADDAELRAASAAFKANDYIVENTVRSWVDDFYTYRTALGGVTSANYVSTLNTWLANAGARYLNDVVFDDETSPTSITTTRIHGNHVKATKSKESVTAMDSLRADIAAVSGNDNGEIFAYGRSWLDYEQYKTIDAEAIRNISVTLAACLVIITILIVDPKTVFAVFLALSMIFVNIVGFMHFWGLSIDSVTVIMLVIALGLAVDYSAHIGRAYLEKRGTPDERIVRTLEDMGVAVWNGAMSTFMAVMILGSSSSYVFMTFFKQLFLCITLGLAHGLIFLPVLLSLLKPAPYAEAR